MVWSLYQKTEGGEKSLEPLEFVSGKTQDQVVREVLDLIESGKNIIFIHGVCGTGKCLDKESLIFCKPSDKTHFSYNKISDLEGQTGQIISLDDRGNLVKSKFNNVRKTGRKKLFKLKTRTGREIIASKNHPFLTITENGLEWISLDNLNERSYICLPNKIDLEETSKLKDDEIKILAHLIAEGKLGDRIGSPVYFQCPKQNPLIRKDYVDSLKSLFPEGEVKSYRGDDVVLIFKDMNTSKGATNKLRLFIKKFGLDGKKSDKKFVPSEIFGLKKEKISLFLSRLFSCGGCVYQKTKGKQIVIEYCSISKRLIQDVSILLQRFGIQHTVTPKKFKGKKDYAHTINISSHSDLRKYIQEIGFIGRKQKLALELLKKLKAHKFTNIDKVPRVTRNYLKNLGYNYTQLDRFLNYEEIEKLRKAKGFKKIRADKSISAPFVFNQLKIDFLRGHIKKINGHVKDKNLSFICNEQIFWDKIKSVEYVKEDETYDLEVPKHHNFIANGIIVHNSAIALNIARNLGKTSIVVPGKSLQAQYKKDYEEDKYLLKNDGSKLNISVMTGRKNHSCKFLDDNKSAIPIIKREVDSNLHNIFEGKHEEIKDKIGDDPSANNLNIPCKIEIKEKNWRRIKEYLKQNKDVNIKDFNDIKDVKRASVAAVCPYWSPVLPERYELKAFSDSKKENYMGLNNERYNFYQGKEGCGFYSQFNSYVDSDVIVFNSLKYKLETALNRKPLTEVEIIDECDEFLDNFSNQRIINLDRFQNSLIQASWVSSKMEDLSSEINSIIQQFKRDERISDAISSEGILPVKETGIYDVFKILVNNQDILVDVDEESYVFDVEETASMFEDFLDDSYLTISKKDEQWSVSIVTTNLAKKFKEIVDKNKIIVLMSGTLHSDEVLKDIYGLDEFEKIDAEVEQQGQIEVQRTGLEIDCKYSNFSSGKFSRGDYLRSLSKCIESAKKPVLVHVNGFVDLPTEQELEEFDVDNLVSRERLIELQGKDKNDQVVERFKKGQIEVLFTTKCARGIDFPGEQCNSIVFTKYPNPNVKDSFWKILNRTQPQHYWQFYKDKARRELLQKVYRGLRSRDDHVYVLSPDSRVLDYFEN